MAITVRHLGNPDDGSDSLWEVGNEDVHKVTEVVYPLELRIPLTLYREQTVAWWNSEIRTRVATLAVTLETDALA